MPCLITCALNGNLNARRGCASIRTMERRSRARILRTLLRRNRTLARCWPWHMHFAATRLCRNRGRGAAVLRWSKSPHDLLCCHAESCARSIRATPELAFAKATAELEKLYLTQNKLAAMREGTLWQRDYFDRLVRDQKHLANCVRYIRRNPKRAGLRNGEYILYESEFARSIE